MDAKILLDVKNWTQVEHGILRYAIAAKVAYEIIIERWEVDKPIETAIASLCVVGYWHNLDGTSTLDREWLGKERPISELLKIAEKDCIENPF